MSSTEVQLPVWLEGVIAWETGFFTDHLAFLEEALWKMNKSCTVNNYKMNKLEIKGKKQKQGKHFWSEKSLLQPSEIIDKNKIFVIQLILKSLVNLT